MNTMKKLICTIVSVTVLIVISPVRINAQALTAQELARIRTEMTQVERQINQLMPQIRNLSQQATTFNQQHLPTAQQALDIIVRNEFNDHAVEIWRSTWNPNFNPGNSPLQLDLHLDRREDRVISIHRNNITNSINNAFPEKIIGNLRLGNVYFQNPGPWVREAYAANRGANNNTIGRAVNLAVRDNGHAIGITEATIGHVECRDINRRYVQARNQEAQLRQRLGSLQNQYVRGGGNIVRR